MKARRGDKFISCILHLLPFSHLSATPKFSQLPAFSRKERASERTLARIFHSISYRPFYFSPLSITPSIKTLALNCSLTPMHRTSAPEERNHQQKTLRDHRQHPQVTKRQARAQDSAPQQRHVASQTCPCVAHNQHANTAEHLQARSEGLDG